MTVSVVDADVKEAAHITASPAQPVWPLLRGQCGRLFCIHLFHVLAHIAVYVFLAVP